MNSNSFDLLEQAIWPAFLVESGGTIRRANPAAVELFGSPLEGDTCSLAALWAAGQETADQFLSGWEVADQILPNCYHILAPGFLQQDLSGSQLVQ